MRMALFTTLVLLVAAVPANAQFSNPFDFSNAVRYGDGGVPLGTISTAASDDSAQLVSLPFSINVFGKVYTHICINTNGLAGLGFSDTDPMQFNNYDKDVKEMALAAGAPMIAVFALDLNPSHSIQGATTDTVGNDGLDDDGVAPAVSRIYIADDLTVGNRPAFAATWYRIKSYNQALSGTDDKYNTFQLVIIKDGESGDFDVEFNYGAVLMPSDGYSTSNPSSGCTENTADCRIGVGFGNYIPAHVATINGQTQVVAASATKHELFDKLPAWDLADAWPNDNDPNEGISAASAPLTQGSLNSAVLGRYTFSMKDGAVSGFFSESDLKDTDWWGKVDSISTNTIVTGVPIKAGPITVEKNGAGAIVFIDNSESSSPPASSITACIAAAEAADAAASGKVCGNAPLTFYTSAYPQVGTSKPASCFCNPTGESGM